MKIINAKTKINKNINGIYKTQGFVHLSIGGGWSPGTIVFFKEGKIHREDGPAIIMVDKFQTKTVFARNDQSNNPNGPSSITYYTSWTVLTENFQVELKPEHQHHQEYWIRKTYSQNGKLHCLLHEAVNEPSTSIKKGYFINGEKLLQKEWKIHPLVVQAKEKEKLKKKIINL